MTDELIASDQPLTTAQRRTLAAVLNMIVPPSADGRLPGAAMIDVLASVDQTAADFMATLRAQLDRLAAAAEATSPLPFAELAEPERARLLNAIRAAEPEFLRDLAVHTVTCYYQDERVLQGLGIEARAPFPKGHEVKSGDLGLLDAVRRRGRIWRDPGP